MMERIQKVIRDYAASGLPEQARKLSSKPSHIGLHRQELGHDRFSDRSIVLDGFADRWTGGETGFVRVVGQVDHD